MIPVKLEPVFMGMSMFARGFKLPQWAGPAGIRVVLVWRAVCPTPVTTRVHNRNARTSAVYMTFGLRTPVSSVR